MKPKRYKSNNRVNLTYLKRMDRRKVKKKLESINIASHSACPHCKSETGAYREFLKETLIRETVMYDGTISQIGNGAGIQVDNTVWENKVYFCLDCDKPIAYIKK